MIYCHLIKIDLPIRTISAHARREKSIRYGHISTLHIWWARRAVAACRALILAALLPDPADSERPPVSYCATTLQLHCVADPAQMAWKPVVKTDQFSISPSAIRKLA